MAIKRFCKVVIFEGEEDRLRSAYSREITSDGAMIFADGVKYGSAQIEFANLQAVHPKGMSRLLEIMAALTPPKLENV